MDRNGFLTVILLFLIVSDSSSAYSLWNLRKLIDVAPKDNSTATKNLPLPSPVPSGKESKASPIDGDKSGKEKPKDPESLNDSTKVNPNSSKNDDHNKDVNPKGSKSDDHNKDTNPKGSESDDHKKDVNPKGSKIVDPNKDVNPKGSKNDDPNKDVNPKGSKSDDHNKASSSQSIQKQNNEGKEKTDGKFDGHSGSDGSCEESTNRCSIQKTLTACIQGLENGSKDLVLLVHNERESPLKVNITIPTSPKKVMGEHEIPKQQTKRINVPWRTDQNTEIELNAGKEMCKLHVGPYPAKGNFLQRLPSYYKQVTPIYGAYLLFLIALVVGGTWACCKFRKRRRQDGGIPYQELEMGLPESASAVNVDSTEGWDEVWDDDWDEDKAVKSPGGRHIGSISANGLTARSSNRDGWERDWDD
ncbi:Dentin sialoprotein [Actinidia chinensis var. chinensis]|uniref:Dentin sialoprotein n=1 Tax=Actinidia chinensis var. chinensis TaxID=1590841 RepID=A0A2R6R8M9_ACTCC|nr:Dentin sialoprotein [Actinidia chinensis var. chinensis]